jgi:pimeloyl-ACP methyl ester carboxylesterase
MNMQMKFRSGGLASLAMALAIACAAASAPSYAQSGQSTQSCASSAWTGTVTYSRTQSMSHSKTAGLVSGRGKETVDFQMNSDYRAVVAVTADPQRKAASIGSANAEHTMISRESKVATESNSCDRGKTWQEMTGTFTNEYQTAGSGKDVSSVTIAVNANGTYSVGVSAPRIKGKTAGVQKASYSGQCVPKQGKNQTFPAMDASIQGGSLASDGSHRIDPAQANRLSGSYSKGNQDITESISWNLEKCGAPLRLTNLTFQDMNFPHFNVWQDISESKGTIDGNLVRIRATVLNASAEPRDAEVKFKETYRGDKWDGARPDAALKDSVMSVSLGPNEAKDVEILWDSSGYAWYDDGRPRLVQRVKAELVEKTKLVDGLTKNLKVAPKPLVLVHGAWSNWHAFESWQNILTVSHSYDWKAFPVGEVPARGEMNLGRDMFAAELVKSMPQNAQALRSYIEYAQEDRNAWHVDLVAHSLGGIIARYYVSRVMPAQGDDGSPQISHLLMLGTPHLGTPCADVMSYAFEMTGNNPEVLRAMRQDTMAAFNEEHTSRKGVKFSALAGNPIPTTCKTMVWNDGFVPVPSALGKFKDTLESKSLHIDLLGTVDFTAFVRPRIAIGPKGNHLPELPTTLGGFLNDASASPFVNVAYRTAAGPSSPTSDGLKPDFAKAIKLTAKQTVDVEIPIVAATNFGITFMASSEVSASLYDEKGTLVAKNLAKTAEARAAFRSLYVDKPVTAGTWKLKLANTGAQPSQAVIATWKNAAKSGAPARVAQR